VSEQPAQGAAERLQLQKFIAAQTRREFKQAICLGRCG
jgi:hypothetical protein